MLEQAQRPYRTRLLFVTVCALAAMLGVTGSAAGDPPGSFLRLNGYGGVTEEVLTSDDVILFGTVGSFASPHGPPQPDLFISTVNLATFERWQITLVPPLGAALAPGTYSNAGGFGAFPERPAIQVLHVGGLPFNYTCEGGSFTIHSIDAARSLFDVEWTQQCLGLSVSGRAVFVPPPDTTPPFIRVPDHRQLFVATGPDGATVSYEVTARDSVDGPVAVTCTPPSGSVFPIGTTTVECSAEDSSGNVATATFDVLVIGAEGLLDGLVGVVTGMAPGTSLVDKAHAARTAHAAGDRTGTCGKLNAFTNEVEAQSGKKLSSAQVEELVWLASRIRAILSCR